MAIGQIRKTLITTTTAIIARKIGLVLSEVLKSLGDQDRRLSLVLILILISGGILFLLIQVNTTYAAAYYSLQQPVIGNQVFVENGLGKTVSVFHDNTVTSITVGEEPGVQMTLVGSLDELVVTNFGSGTLSIINVLNDRVVKTVSGLDEPLGVAYVPTTNSVYVSNYGTNMVFEISLSSYKVLARIQVGSGPMFLLYNSVNQELYVGNHEASTVSVINPETNEVIDLFRVGTPGNASATGMAFDPANNETYFPVQGASQFYAFDLQNKRVGTLSCGCSDLWQIAYNPINRDMYVTGRQDGNVYVFSSSNNLVATIGGFYGATGIAYDSHDKLMYVANFNENDVQTIRGTKLDFTFPVGAGPFDVVVE